MSASDAAPRRYQLLVCDGPSCGVTHESERFKAQVAARRDADPSLAARLSCVDFTCFGFCDDGPNVLVRELAPGEDGWKDPKPGAIEGVRGLYLGNDEAKIDRILEAHVGRGEPLPDVREY